MKYGTHRTSEAGFIKALTVFVVAIGALIVIFAALASYIGPITPGSLSSLTSPAGSGGSNYSGSAISGSSNTMLSFLNNTPNPSGHGGSSSGAAAGNRSPYAGSITLGDGNASYSVQPFEEYVTLRNDGSAPVDITGWKLTNGKGTRPVQSSSYSYIYPVADSATIGQGTEFLDPSGVFKVGPIVLQPGDTALLTTGQPFAQFPYSIYTSFRENKCEGYLKNYPFEPALNLSCPRPENDPTIRTVTNECEDYMNSLNTCEDPQKYDKDNFDLQTAQCKSFMVQRLNYAGCVAMHRADQNFNQNQWRVFLGKTREMWADRNETITLYDARDLIVDQISY